ncbi:hypothetical protein B0T25DRAFT_569526 [Lasiosphaeria hispida]|uniref:Ankyrin repeat protein n=1 Tax=Lasiosphaeria hispida TaxID=260671 RepID=A0AAJ0HDH6_9PEZI|nr:hypothetical protein B0T25DRAFT_569526 [Lasiosphaeria hispida]
MPSIWQTIVDQTYGTGFEPLQALLMTSVIRLKRPLTPPADDTESSAVVTFARKSLGVLGDIADLEGINPSDMSKTLTWEVHRVLQHRWDELGLQTTKLDRAQDSEDQNPGFGLSINNLGPKEGSIAAIANRLGTDWYLRASAFHASSTQADGAHPLPYGPSSELEQPPLSLLIYALSFHELAFLLPTGIGSVIPWVKLASRYPTGVAPSYQGDGSEAAALASVVPNVDLVQHLLNYGSDPNEDLNGNSVWEYVVQLVHILGHLNTDRLHLWINVFRLMLEHGADPYACCLPNRPNIWDVDKQQARRSFCPTVSSSVESESAEREEQGPSRRVVEVLREHASTCGRSPSSARARRGVDENQWDSSNSHAYFHSVTAVIKDVFEPSATPGTSELLALVETKKQLNIPSRRAKNARTSGSENSEVPRWIS